MLKGEIEILTTIALNRCTFKQIAGIRLARSSTYIISTIESLVRRGYIIKNESKGYQLTEKGAKTTLQYSNEYRALRELAMARLQSEYSARTKVAINMIETLGNEYAKQVAVAQN